MSTRLEQIMVKMGFDVSESSKVNDAMNRVNQDTKKAGEGVAGFNTKGREMHELINKLGQSSPLLGSALKACFSPEAAGIALFIGLLELVKSQIEKVEGKVKEMTAEMRDMWLSEQDSAMKAQEVYEGYEQKIAEILDTKKQKLEDENNVYARQLVLIKELQSGHEKVVDAVNEAADADLKRKRAREDKTIAPQDRAAVAAHREIEDATIKRQREKQADTDAATAEQATKKLMAGRLKALESEKQKALDDGKALAEEQKKQLAAKYTLEAQQGKNLEKLKKEMADADAEINRRGGGTVLHNLARTASYAMGDVGANLRRKDEAGLADAQKKKTDLEAEYKKMLQDRSELQKKIEASSKSISDNEVDVAAKAKAVNDLKQKQADLNQQITQNQLERQRVGSVRDQELAQLKSDLAPGGSLTQSEILGNVIASDSTLQQAKEHLANAKTQAERDYNQKIIDSRMAMDRARFAGVLTPEELRAGAQSAGEADPNTEFLKDIRDILAGDK